MPINELIHSLSKMPGVGSRSAQRIALYLLKNDKIAVAQLITVLQDVYEKVHKCENCGNFSTARICNICADPARDATQLCIVETVSDLWALERAKFFRGRYHVLGGVLSAIDNIGPDNLNIKELLARMQREKIEEVIVALSATLEGQSTLFYLMDVLEPFHVRVSSLAQGVPIGGELNYMDNATLSTAFQDRRLLAS
ncbi:MAG: recombination mediator RecR [Holosporales bacterium]|jgi:recombination protein RecR|nr:recombination mediator RecR [Holosporales bacterium]